MNHLRTTRLAAKLTQEQLASRSRVSVRTITSAEQGRPLRQFTKRQLLKALGVSWDSRATVFPSK